MNIKLFFSAIIKFLIGVIFAAALLFLPAGSLCYWNAWLLMGVLFVPMFAGGIVMMIINPELLKKRLNGKEKENQQKAVIALSGIMFISGFVAAGLGFRFNLFILPKAVCIAAAVVFLIAYALYAEVLRENIYLSRTVEIQENQKVIDTGLYGIVRHPMYAVTVLMFLAIPLVLGSLISFAVFCVYPFILAMRIRNEEEVLTKELAGYDEYKKKVKYRMIPFIW